MMKTNYHTHTLLCGHASGSVEDYVVEAINHNFDVLGFSDHGPLPNPPMKRMSFEEFENIYLKDIEKCKKKYDGKIKILTGLELEFFEEDLECLKSLRKRLDYMVLGEHWFSAHANESEGHSTFHLVKEEELVQYTDITVKAIETGLFDYVAHPDLFMIRYEGSFESIKESARRITEAAIKHNCVLEYNANGFRNRGGVFPTSIFWSVVAEMGCRVVIGSDAHDPKWLDDEYTNFAIRRAQSIGLNVVDSF